MAFPTPAGTNGGATGGDRVKADAKKNKLQSLRQANANKQTTSIETS